LLIVFTTVILSQASNPNQQLYVSSPQDRSQAVRLAQPITLKFTEPMDPTTTQQAIHIRPTTKVTYHWVNSQTLDITPVNKGLAPNTRYQVTLSTGAQTQTHQPIPEASATPGISFVTVPPPAPGSTPQPTGQPSPSPSSTPNPLGNVHELGAIGAQAPVWSTDGSTVYVVGPQGQLTAYSATGGVSQALASSGVTLVAAGPQGVAYVANGSLAYDGQTQQGVAPAAIGFRGNQLLTLVGQVVASSANPNLAKLAEAPQMAEFSPDGTQLAYLGTSGLHIVNLPSNQDQVIGPATALGAWSPLSSQLTYVNGTSIEETTGGTPQTLLSEAGVSTVSWSSNGLLLLSGSSGVQSAVAADGSGVRQLAAANVSRATWSSVAGAATFAYVENGNAYVAQVVNAQTPQADQNDIVSQFMKARVAGDTATAQTYLDASGKQDFSTLPLVYSGSQELSWYSVLLSQPSGEVVVRIVLSTRTGSHETAYDEMLQLVRDPASGHLLIHGATDGAQRSLDSGPEVVSLSVQANQVRVAFDSDLDPATVTGAIAIAGQQSTQTAYDTKTRTVTVQLAQPLQAGKTYQLQVAAALKDSSEHAANAVTITVAAPNTPLPAVTPSPSPSPATTTTPSPTPS
ncbi:MAG: Ig-like domain-containing protein, partial [Candidatus Dormiibacterota bacterium]